MPTSISSGTSAGTAASSGLPSRSRSREGASAGSSGQPGRRNQRASNVLPAWFVEHARRMLHKQRAFRVDQLRHLDATAGETSDATREEIDANLREAARSVVILVDAALRRIDRGNYGHCQRCGDLMSLNRLMVLPMSTLCTRCQQTGTVSGLEPASGCQQPRGPAS
jgi:DnaK suppressor protein